jgi:hypothetical protein
LIISFDLPLRLRANQKQQALWAIKTSLDIPYSITIIPVSFLDSKL